ncbi:MAG: hypothetical protein PHY28_00770 [Dehalococcoidales bacterium]|nr:hypothetical protein [Dehalococcoidales bacterium]
MKIAISGKGGVGKTLLASLLAKTFAEVGIEHLTRWTARAVDKLIVVVEPGQRSIETARRIFDMAKELNLKNIAVVANKIQNQSQQEFIIKSLPDIEFLGFIPYDKAINRCRYC